MSDFLKNLRSSYKKEIPHPRKKPDGQLYIQQDRRNASERRSAYQGAADQPPTTNLKPGPVEVTPELLENLTRITEMIETFVNSNELLTASKIRRQNAVSDILETLNRLLLSDGFNGSSQSVPQATASYASGTHYTKDDILEMIQDMRDQGATFSVIADYLQEKGIPTFSGRGAWHAQTIHRLCK
ncbi:MAG: recombinase family protein [Desulfobacterales bacterium]|nr:recombinase family protein [Desulfobacterales bacterium]